MNAKEALAAYQVERDELLESLSDRLADDPRVEAAWLFGSLGRGTADELSDLDLFGVVRDEHVQAMVAGHRAYAAEIGKVVLTLEAPQNAPEGGGYLMVYYDAPRGPHQVDWYWQPQSRAAIPTDTLLLFDRAGLPRGNGPTTFPARQAVSSITEQPKHFVGFFWAMLMITAKHAMREPRAGRMELLRYVLGSLGQVQRWLGHKAEPTVETLTAHAQPGEKARVLRALAKRMGGLMAEAVARGEVVPEAIVEPAYRYLNLVEGALTEASSEAAPQ
jgi:predicted nucleotidyltransferase